jgi:hypothetical protein
MILTNENSYPVQINNIEKETEKAYLISVPVCWAGNRAKTRSFWFPKSCVEIKNNVAIVAKFILSKLESANYFNGYFMTFYSAKAGDGLYAVINK